MGPPRESVTSPEQKSAVSNCVGTPMRNGLPLKPEASEHLQISELKSCNEIDAHCTLAEAALESVSPPMQTVDSAGESVPVPTQVRVAHESMQTPKQSAEVSNCVAAPMRNR